MQSGQMWLHLQLRENVCLCRVTGPRILKEHVFYDFCRPNGLAAISNQQSQALPRTLGRVPCLRPVEETFLNVAVNQNFDMDIPYISVRRDVDGTLVPRCSFGLSEAPVDR